MMKTLARCGALLCSWFLLTTTSSVGGATLDLVLSSQTAQTGQPLSAEIVISGVAAGGPPSVGAFDLEVTFDATILSAPSITFGPFLGDLGAFEAIAASSFSPSAVEIAEVSLSSPESRHGITSYGHRRRHPQVRARAHDLRLLAKIEAGDDYSGRQDCPCTTTSRRSVMTAPNSVA